MARRITKAQVKKIWTKIHELDMSEEQLRDLVTWVSGQSSTRELTRFQGKVVIDVMEGNMPISDNTSLSSLPRGKEPRFLRPRKFPKMIGHFLPLATPKQISLIENIKKEAGWDDEHVKNHVRKYYKINSVPELDIKQAGSLIDVLKREKNKRTKEETHVLS